MAHHPLTAHRLKTRRLRPDGVWRALLLPLVAAGPSAAAAATGAGFECRAGEVRGVAEADALTAVEIVCEEIRRRAPGTGAYQVSVRTLGRQIVLTAARDDAATSITVLLDAIEALSTSAPRVAEALLAGKPLAATQRVDNLLESETRPSLSKRGSVKFTTGVTSCSPLGHGGTGAGLSIGLTYAAPRFALPVAMRFGWTDGDQTRDASFFAISAGGRYYVSRRDVSPFLGAGISMLRLGASDWRGGREFEPSFEADRLGAAPYLEAGLEVLRLHRARLAFTVHADFPTGPLRSPERPVYGWDPSRRQTRLDRVVPAESRYVVPATLGVAIAF